MTDVPTAPSVTNKVVVIAGPTASGKSGLALAIAATLGGVVINADSMQVYRGLRVLTAGPSAADEALAPHCLYGVLPPREACSAGRWQVLATDACRQAWAAGRLPVVVGGTGLYLRALTEGLSPIPEVPEAVRGAARAEFAALGNEAFYRLLQERDPVMAARLHPSNSQRLVRAWEVLAATGRSLAHWQETPPDGGLAADVFKIVILPDRARLYAGCDARFLRMMEEGALAEARALMAEDLDPALPAMRALGVPDLIAHLKGERSLAQAVAGAQQATRNYAKRQMTWFRHQMMADLIIDTQFSESLNQTTFALIRHFLLTAGK